MNVIDASKTNQLLFAAMPSSRSLHFYVGSPMFVSVFLFIYICIVDLLRSCSSSLVLLFRLSSLVIKFQVLNRCPMRLPVSSFADILMCCSFVVVFVVVFFVVFVYVFILSMMVLITRKWSLPMSAPGNIHVFIL